MGGEQREGALGVGGRRDAVLLVAEPLLDEGADLGLIVNDQYPLHGENQ
jgi:hypothetical protein